MILNRTLLCCVLCLLASGPLASFGPLAPSAAEAVQVGGFNLERGGPFSISEGSLTAQFRTVLPAEFPGTTFSGTSELTAAYLSNVDVLILTTAYSETEPITPLSVAEQAALVTYVQGGGSALIMGERMDMGPATNASLLGPFGLEIVGGTFENPDATVLDPLSVPFTAGPFGEVSSLLTINPGWFGSVGTTITVATLDSNGSPVLTYAPENSCGPGSGRVIFAADSNLYTENLTLVFNSFQYLSVPEPSSVGLALIGFVVVAMKAVRRRNVAV